MAKKICPQKVWAELVQKKINKDKDANIKPRGRDFEKLFFETQATK